MTVRWKSLACEMFVLLDAVERSLPDDIDRAEKLLAGRLRIAERNGLIVQLDSAEASLALH